MEKQPKEHSNGKTSSKHEKGNLHEMEKQTLKDKYKGKRNRNMRECLCGREITLFIRVLPPLRAPPL